VTGVRNDAAGVLGIARRAGSLAWGLDSVVRAARDGRAQVVILARDAGEHSARSMRRECERTGCRLVVWGEKDLIGDSIGTNPCAVAAITEPGLARTWLRALGRHVRGERG